jgi:putative SOS response-associated peptidase YedK
MCNLCSLTKGQAAIRDWFRAPHDRTANLPLFPAIFPDQMAPIIRRGPNGERELVMCVVPATSFCEYADTKPRKTPKWFALSEDRPLFAFAGLWTPWRGLRGPKSAPIEGEHELNRRVGHPVKRDVVEHVVAGEAIRRAPIDRAPTTADMIAAAGWP